MGEPLATAGSTSSDYFEPEDLDFNQALQTTVLPGDVQELEPVGPAEPEDHAQTTRTQPTLKRSRSTVEKLDASPSSRHVIPVEERPYLSDEDEETYGAASFGGFGQYMRRKRAKLQIQNAQMDDTGDKSSEKSRIFQGIAIYVRCRFVRACVGSWLSVILAHSTDRWVDGTLRPGSASAYCPTWWRISCVFGQESTCVCALLPQQVTR